MFHQRPTSFDQPRRRARRPRIRRPLLLALSLFSLAGALGCNGSDGDDSQPATTRMSAASGEQVTLDARAVSRGLGSTATYHWQHIDGPEIPIADPGNPVLAFTAPFVANLTELILRVDAVDGAASQANVFIIEIRPATNNLACGDGSCGSDEDCTSCPSDCGACPVGVCDDGTCASGEDCNSCPADCGACPTGACGNGACESNEHCDTCAADCGTCPSGPPAIARGPYLQSASSHAITVKWRTDAPTDSVVAYGPDPDHLVFKSAVDGERTNHEVTLAGLAPNTAYAYAFGASDRDLHGKEASYQFRTFPPIGAPSPARVWVIGDSGKSGSDQQAVFAQYKQYTGSRGTDLWLMLGDNAYNDGRDSEYQESVFDAYADLLRGSPLFATLGNHDDCLDRLGESSCSDLPASLDSVTPYYEIFTLPQAGESGGVPSGTEAYYSFDYGTIHFVCLNSQTHSDSAAMETWLEADLAATTATWIVAFWHHPPYSNGSHNSDGGGSLADMRERFVPILEAYGVDLVFAGHSHTYERSALLNGYYGNSSTFDPDLHAVARNADGSLADGDASQGDGAYVKTGPRGAVYSVVGSSSRVSSSDFPTRYWTCKDGFMVDCDGGPLLPGMVLYLEHLGSVVLDFDSATNAVDVSFLDATTGTITDGYRIEKQ